MTMKPTPGPYWVDYTTIKNTRGESICSSGNNRKVWGDELKATLRLMAAAPELLEALEYIAGCPQGYVYAEIREAARRAIAKARGE